MTGQPTYIELGTPDPARAMAFYSALLGWQPTPMPGGGGSASTQTLGIGFHGGDPLTHHEVFYAVDDLEAATAAVQQLGGSLRGGVHESPGFGRWTECDDDQGAHFGLVVREPAPPPPTVWPTLWAADAPAMIAFLGAAFGFVVTERVDDGALVRHAELAWPEGGGVMLGSIRPDDSRHPAGCFDAYLVTAGPDALHARAIAHGATNELAPHDTDYGSRACAVSDPEGNVWSFGSYPGAPVPG